jgi:glucokinase
MFIYDYFCKKNPNKSQDAVKSRLKAAPEVQKNFKNKRNGEEIDFRTPFILEAAIEDKDTLSCLALNFYFKLFGLRLRNKASDILPTGGVHLSGGVMNKLYPYLTTTPKAIDNLYKGLSCGYLREYLIQIPIYVQDYNCTMDGLEAEILKDLGS